ncbi:MAG TPA: pyridoxal 5'-phosphate synthase glutaminase subunit PdxT [Blastocatellia bacterium]|jgi:5'-phosphate synthase pdxT subunit|nr:pyridoxal 5'-phosphate synthase glutaminase subunit PdxT [Blastocatellia bacterium]
MKIGVLAIQGDFAAHARALARLGVSPFEVRTESGLEGIDGLVLPGGESTTMLKLLTEENLIGAIKALALAGRPLFGTCAGAILLASEVTNPAQSSLGLIDIGIERNAYGRQVDSFIGEARTVLEGGSLEAVFIRAPRIKRVGADVEVLADVGGEPVFVREKSILAATFHPELTEDSRPHAVFLDLVRRSIA